MHRRCSESFAIDCHCFSPRSITIKLKPTAVYDDNDNDDDDDELLCILVDWEICDKSSEFLTISNLSHVARKIQTSAEPKFKLCRRNLCSIGNYCTTAPLWKYFKICWFWRLSPLHSLNICQKFCIYYTIFSNKNSSA